MVQIGNFHIGKPMTARLQALTAGEAYILWDSLTTRYDIIYATKLYINFVHDTDFKLYSAVWPDYCVGGAGS